MTKLTSLNVCECGTSLRVKKGYTHAVCESCRKSWFPTSIEKSEDAIVPLGRPTGFHCPQCTEPLYVGNVDSTQVCYCESCRGFVVDSRSLGDIISSRRRTYRGPDDQPVMVDLNELTVHQTCPACFEKMEPHHYNGPGNVILDTCRGCQLAWLDHGELSKISRAPGRR